MITTTPIVELKTSRQEGQFAALVTLAGLDQTRVRFKRMEHTAKRDWQWDCDEHGQHMFATCEHERAALAEYRKARDND